MAQTGYTPILIYSSTTVAQAPAVGNLTNSTLGSELAINITDGKLFYKDNANAVQVIAWKTTPTTAGGTGLTSYTAGDLLYYASGTALTKLPIGATGRWLGSSGTAPQWNAPAALTKTDDTNVTLTLGGSASTALLNAASLTLGWTGQLATSRGGTGLSSFTANGLVYASSTSALATSSSATWNGSRLALSTNATAGTNNVLFSLSDGTYPNSGLPTMIFNGFGAGNGYTGAIYGTQFGGIVVATADTFGGTYTASMTFANGNPADITFHKGNLIQGTAAKGINFTANTPAAGMTSQLLNWYEEGAWATGMTADGGTVTLSFDKMNYTRVGRMVTLSGEIVVSAISSPTGDIYLNLPFTAAASSTGRSGAWSSYLGVAYTFTGTPGGPMVGLFTGGATKMTIRVGDNAGGATASGFLAVGTTFNFGFTYQCQ